MELFRRYDTIPIEPAQARKLISDDITDQYTQVALVTVLVYETSMYKLHYLRYSNHLIESLI